MSKDYYSILGVQKSANKEEIKKAFRTLAHQYHPDKKGGNEKKFKEANEAYSVLSDDSKRAQYDQFGSAGSGFNPGQGEGFGGFGGFSSQGAQAHGFDFSNFADGFDGLDLGDIFGDFFGGGRRQERRGRDISISIDLSFADSIFGVDRRILITKDSACSVCTGTGGRPGSRLEVCSTCNGKGKVHESRRSFIGVFNSVKICSTCHGRGQVPKEKCEKCRGVGILKQEQEVAVRIPPGISDGEVIRMAGAGEAIASGNSGDLYIKVRVKSHSLFKKEGNNLIADIKVKLSDALLGGEYNLQTLDGPITVKIPEGVRHGEILRIKGKGVVLGHNKRGDLLLIVQVQIPEKLSKNGRKLVEDLKNEGY